MLYPVFAVTLMVDCEQLEFDIGDEGSCEFSLKEKAQSISEISFTLTVSGDAISVTSIDQYPFGFDGVYNPNNGKVSITTPQLGQDVEVIGRFNFQADNDGESVISLKVVSMLDDNFDTVEIDALSATLIVGAEEVVEDDEVIEEPEEVVNEGNALDADPDEAPVEDAVVDEQQQQQGATGGGGVVHEEVVEEEDSLVVEETQQVVEEEYSLVEEETQQVVEEEYSLVVEETQQVVEEEQQLEEIESEGSLVDEKEVMQDSKPLKPIAIYVIIILVVLAAICYLVFKNLGKSKKKGKKVLKNKQRKLLLIVLIAIVVIVITGFMVFKSLTGSKTTTAFLLVDEGVVQVNDVLAVDGMGLDVGDFVKTLSGRATIVLFEGETISLSENSVVKIEKINGEETILEQIKGETWSRVNKLNNDREFKMRTSEGLVSALGTAFNVNVNNGVVVFVGEGNVAIGSKKVKSFQKVKLLNSQVSKLNLSDVDYSHIKRNVKNDIKELKQLRVRESQKNSVIVEKAKEKYNVTDAMINDYLQRLDNGEFDIDEILSQVPLKIPAIEKIRGLTEKIIELNQELASFDEM